MPGSRSWTAYLPALAGFGWLALVWPLLGAVYVLADDLEPLEKSSVATEGVLIMRDTGAVVTGKILQFENSYTVFGLYGNAQFPADQVRMRCDSLQHAYSRLHELTISHQSANSHVSLAKWCATNELDKEAILELNAALKLEPDREDVQRMLLNVTETLKSGRKSPPTPQPEKPENTVRPARTDAATTDDSATVGGLSLSQALQYTRRIQPLLVKTCATTGCHTRESNNGFQLYHVIPGKNSNRHASELNLAAVLEQIDMKKPSGSRLLTVSRTKHGRNSRPVFTGQRGDEQFAELEDWVLAVARDESRRSKSAAGDGSRKTSVRTTSAGERDSAAVRIGDRDPFAGKMLSPPAPIGGERRERTVSESTRDDPFDPASFNRQSGGRSGR